MSGIEFHQTRRGAKFFDADLPRLIAALEASVKPPAPIQWEYKVRYFYSCEADIPDTLNELGQAGWELVACHPYIHDHDSDEQLHGKETKLCGGFVFKRPKQ